MRDLELVFGGFFAAILAGSALHVAFSLWADVREWLGRAVHSFFTFLNHW